MKAQIIVSLCGALAELEFGFDKSASLSNDLTNAYGIAYEIINRYGTPDQFDDLFADLFAFGWCFG